MEKIVGLKELRQNIEKYVKEVAKGHSFIVVRKSKPIFHVGPLEEEWEEIVDFTKVRKGGVNIKELISRL